MSSHTCFIILGPTAVGKTALAIRLARLLDTTIISADSRQCYREMNIGVAKPSGAELALVPHYFINSHSLQQPVHAAGYEQYALAAAAAIFREHATAVLCGGTGLYIQAFCQGMDHIPAITPEIREALRSQYDLEGLAWLQEQVQREDPLYHAEGEIQNPHRLLRALEVVRTTGRSIRSFQQGLKTGRDFRIVKIGLELPRPELNRRIDLRVEDMIREGLVEEVSGLLPYRPLPPLNTIGYKEVFDYLDGQVTLAEAIEHIRIHTRQYAKRQMTWFKRDHEIQWFQPGQEESILSYCREQVLSDPRQ